MSTTSAKLEALFKEAVALPAEEVGDFLGQIGARDPKLQSQLAGLLESDRRLRAEGFMDWDSPRSALESSSPKPPDSMIGRVIDGYVLLESVGEGVNGIVYKAMSPRRHEASVSHEFVAIKLLRSWNLDSKGLARFEHESLTLERISHPNVIQILDSGVTDATAYIVMPLMAGHSLKEWMVQNPRTPLSTRLNWFLAICHGVAAAHREMVIHRDLKPSNILLNHFSDGKLVPVVTDFGIAKSLMTEKDATELTRTGETLGTPRYMAPEQFGSGGPVNTLADVYGLGAVLFFLLTNRAPFAEVDIFDVANAVRNSGPESPSTISEVAGVSSDLDAICLKSLQRSQADRYQSVTELIDDIERFLEHRPIKASPISLWRRSRLWIQANPRVARLSTAFAATVLVGLGMLLWFWSVAAKERDLALKTNQELVELVRSQAFATRENRDDPTFNRVRLNLLRSLTKQFAEMESRGPLDSELLNVSAIAWLDLAGVSYNVNQKHDLLAQQTAKRQFETLAQRHPESQQFRFDLFHWHNRFGESNEAFRIIDQLVQESPSNTDYLNCLSAACRKLAAGYFGKGDVAKAEPLLGKSIDVANQAILVPNCGNRDLLEKALSRAYYRRAQVNFHLQNRKRAKADLEMSIHHGKCARELMPGDDAAMTHLLEGVLFRGSLHLSEGNLGLAKQDVEFCTNVMNSDLIPRRGEDVRYWGAPAKIMFTAFMLATELKDDVLASKWNRLWDEHRQRWTDASVYPRSLVTYSLYFEFGMARHGNGEVGRATLDSCDSILGPNSNVRILFALLDRKVSRAESLLRERCRSKASTNSEEFCRKLLSRIVVEKKGHPAKPFVMTESEENMAMAFTGHRLQFFINRLNSETNVR